jgi:hypothetical protein
MAFQLAHIANQKSALLAPVQVEKFKAFQKN